MCLNAVDLSSETNTPSFTEEKTSLQCQQQGFYYQIFITVCAKPLLQVMFTSLKTKKTLRKPGSLWLLGISVSLVTWASAACIQGRTYANT